MPARDALFSWLRGEPQNPLPSDPLEVEHVGAENPMDCFVEPFVSSHHVTEGDIPLVSTCMPKVLKWPMGNVNAQLLQSVMHSCRLSESQQTRLLTLLKDPTFKLQDIPSPQDFLNAQRKAPTLVCSVIKEIGSYFHIVAKQSCLSSSWFDILLGASAGHFVPAFIGSPHFQETAIWVPRRDARWTSCLWPLCIREMDGIWWACGTMLWRINLYQHINIVCRLMQNLWFSVWVLMQRMWLIGDRRHFIPSICGFLLF